MFSVSVSFCFVLLVSVVFVYLYSVFVCKGGGAGGGGGQFSAIVLEHDLTKTNTKNNTTLSSFLLLPCPAHKS